MAKVTAAGIGLRIRIGIAIGIRKGVRWGRSTEAGTNSSRVSAYDNRKKGQNQLKRPAIQPAAMARTAGNNSNNRGRQIE